MEPLELVLDLVVGKLPLGTIVRRITTLVEHIHVRRNLVTLPLEVILEIMKVVDWHTLLNIRQSCKFLNELSKALPVWRSQYQQYVAGKICPSRLEEPLGSYSSADLEKWVLLRRSVDLGWKHGDHIYTQTQKIKHPDIYATFFVPGGRWLMVANFEGDLLAFDLNASPITKTILVPRDEGQQLISLIAIDICSDPGIQNLTFNMAVSPSSPSRNGSPIKIHIWRITLIGHGSQALLTSNHLHSFEADIYAHIEWIDIHANLFARSTRNRSLWFTEVFDWSKSTPSAHCKATIFTEESPNEFRLLPGNRLLAFSRHYLTIYAFTTIEGVSVAAPTEVPHVTSPLWTLPFDGEVMTSGGVSDGIFDSLATFFILCTNSQICHLAISHTDDAPRLSVLMNFDGPEIAMASLTSEKAFIHYRYGQLAQLGYSWNCGVNLEVALTSLSTHTFSGDVYYRSDLLQLDEETGRIVQTSLNSISVFDTALLFRK